MGSIGAGFNANTLAIAISGATLNRKRAPAFILLALWFFHYSQFTVYLVNRRNSIH